MQIDNNIVNETNISQFKKIIFKYLFFWKWFVLSLVICISISVFFLRYTHNVYSTSAKVKILDKKKASITLPSAKDLFSKSNINIENEIEILKSYPILKNVVENLRLNTVFYGIANIKEIHLLSFPFSFVPNDKLINKIKYHQQFTILFDDNGLVIESEISDVNNDVIKSKYVFNSYSTYKKTHNLPFDIDQLKSNTDYLKYNSYKLVINSKKQTVNDLKKKINFKLVGKESEIISISLNSSNFKYAQNILNNIIDVFDVDGVNDRRLIHRRTIDFVNDRFLTLSSELDSIEILKKNYKYSSRTLDIKVNSQISLEQSAKYNQELFYYENQVELAKLLLESIVNINYDLLPSNIGIENTEINTLISEYNEKRLKSRNLSFDNSINNFSFQILEGNLVVIKDNIITSIKSYINQLNTINSKLITKNKRIDTQLLKIPQVEKQLRSIDRNQLIKESLYLFLLQKREEAEVSFAITEPTIKVVEYAITDDQPVSPHPPLMFLASILLGLFFPILILYLFQIFNTKIHSKSDVEELNLGASVIGEIPQIMDDEVIFDNPTNRSVLAESFRMLSSNLKYMLDKNVSCHVILSTSTIKGEGKTFSAVNTSLALASLNKKVLLIGCDLRNPQLHKYLNLDKSIKGLVNYLVDSKDNWRDSLQKCFVHHPTHDILLSGALPPNPVQLFSNGNLEKLLADAKKDYDYIILDTAPTILVTDTITIAHLADAVLYVSRANLTEKEVLHFPKELISSGKIKNVGVIINGLGAQNKYGYSYGYKYGYNYKYSYNYGYGYGYEEDKS